MWISLFYELEKQEKKEKEGTMFTGKPEIGKKRRLSRTKIIV